MAEPINCGQGSLINGLNEALNSLLDGKVADAVQIVIDIANKQISSCKYCDKEIDYRQYPRGGRYHSKGELNRSKPLYYGGVKFNPGFMDFVGGGDMCMDCADEHHVLKTLHGEEP